MSKKVSYEEQIEMGLVPQRKNFVTPEPTVVRRMTAEESAALQGMIQTQVAQQVIQLPQASPGTHTGHVRHTDDPITNAQASLLYSSAIAGVSALVIAGLLLLSVLEGYLQIGMMDAIGIEVVGTGVVTLIALIINRSVGLHHSATGIAHHEQRSQVKMHNRSAGVEEHRIDADRDVRLAEIEMRREVAQELVKRIGGA